MGKGCLHFFSAVLDLILFIVAGNYNIHESLDEFEIWLDLTTGSPAEIQYDLAIGSIENVFVYSDRYGYSDLKSD